jgi:hypothetical protein
MMSQNLKIFNDVDGCNPQGFSGPSRRGVAVLLFLATFLITATVFIQIHYMHKLARSIDHNEKNLRAIDAGGDFSFAVFADNKNSYEKLRHLAGAVNSDDENLFSVFIGDIVQDGEMRKLMLMVDHMRDFKKPLLVAIGNHEIYNHMDADGTFYNARANFKTIFGDAYFSFARGESFFIILDDANSYSIDDRQFEWLQRRLEESRKYKYRFVFMHVPLFDPSGGNNYGAGRSLTNLTVAKKLTALFDRFDVTMLFMSHLHGYYQGAWGKTPYIITGGAGARLHGDDPEHFFYHYIKVNVTPSGVTYEVRKHAQKGFSHFQRIKHIIIDAVGYTYYFFVYQYWYIAGIAALFYDLAFIIILSGRRKRG